MTNEVIMDKGLEEALIEEGASRRMPCHPIGDMTCIYFRHLSDMANFIIISPLCHAVVYKGSPTSSESSNYGLVELRQPSLL